MAQPETVREIRDDNDPSPLGRDSNSGHVSIKIFSMAGRCSAVRKSSRVDSLAQSETVREIRDANAPMPPVPIDVRDLHSELCNSSRAGTISLMVSQSLENLK